MNTLHTRWKALVLALLLALSLAVPAAAAETETAAADLQTLADTLGTITYELLCAVGPRVPRLYLG